MAKIILVEGDVVTVLPDVNHTVGQELKKNRIYTRYPGDTRFSKDIRRMLLGLEIEKLKKELYLVDEG